VVNRSLARRAASAAPGLLLASAAGAAPGGTLVLSSQLRPIGKAATMRANADARAGALEAGRPGLAISTAAPGQGQCSRAR